MWSHFHLSILLLCCAALDHVGGSQSCQPMAICVVTENKTGCLRFEANITCQLPNISQITSKWDQKLCVSIRLTKGRHFLDELTNFSKEVLDLQISGESSKNRSTILCNNAGIKFCDLTGVTIANVVFDNCGHLQKLTSEEDMKLTALNFDKTKNVELENVMLNNSRGLAVYAYNGNVTLNSCSFQHSFGGHMIINFKSMKNYYLVSIYKSGFYNGFNVNGSGGLEIRSTHPETNLEIYLSECNFSANNGSKGSHLLIDVNDNSGTDLCFTHCEFSDGRGDYGVFLKSTAKNATKVLLSQCRFINNHIGGLRIEHIQYIEVNNSSIYDNTGTGIAILKNSNTKQQDVLRTFIFNSRFSSNSQALYLNIALSRNEISQETHIEGCVFSDHNLSINSSSVLSIEGSFTGDNEVHIKGSNFENNYNVYENICSVLLLHTLKNVVLEDLSFLKNNCTGIALISSNIMIQRSLNLVGNAAFSGGGLRLESSKATINNPSGRSSRITLDQSSTINIANNTASRYGGGIYTDQTCNDSPYCFFNYCGGIPQSPIFIIKGNWAGLGGDGIFGGCLSKCLTNNSCRQEHTNPQKFMHILSANKSLSTIADHPTKVVICSTETSSSCDTNYTLNTSMGRQFNISLMAVDDNCTPSVEFIESKVREFKIDGVENYMKTRKYCDKYPFFVKGSPKANSTITIELFLHREGSAPALLNVVLLGCPTGFEFNSNTSRCVCKELVKSKHVECVESTGSLKIPAFTWIGTMDGRVAINGNCQYCHRGTDVTIEDPKNGSQTLCSSNRTGVLCGKCVAGYSLQLGGYNCAKCFKSAARGILLIIGCAIAGVATVILLLSLNLTVSTGLINGLIFYSNIVYSNSEIFLPRDSDSITLNRVVGFLSTFQAWINLDFGIVTCFFASYDTYTSAWIQFVFPLYIWLLILVIVLASRYSKRISTITTSNTVPVLATLLLLSYAKLLKTSIEAISYTDVEFLDDASKRHVRVWIQDGNILYFHRKHIPLFLMSLVTIVTYIIPFTLLILLGPLLQAKSHFRVLRWVNKLKPFLDAFYGPYTSRYRYWPGILLLTRMAIFVTYAVYSLGDSPFKLMTVSVFMAVLLLVWMLIGKTQSTSLYQKSHLNYIELFFLLNLAIFTVASIYHSHVSKNAKNQQGLAVGMVGSVLVAFCGILVYQIFPITLRYKAMQNVARFCVSQKIRFAGRKDVPLQNIPKQNETEAESDHSTHSSVEITDPNSMLREPLLTN